MAGRAECRRLQGAGMNQKKSSTPAASRTRVSATRVRATGATGAAGGNVRSGRHGGTSSTAALTATSTLAPLSVHNHPLVRHHYRVATSAIESFVDLVEHCIRVLIPGALIHARPRMGKTHAIDYVALHLARKRPDILVLRMSCEHHRSDFEGPFFSTLLGAAGVREPQGRTIAEKRFALMRRLSEQLQLRSGHIVVLLCDEAQRMSRHALEWLRDVHDQLAHHGLRLITFLVGQPQLMEHKARYQLAGDEQIVARFMIEQLHFRSAAEAATCLASYDVSRYPEGTGDTFTAFFYPLAYGAGLRLEHSAADLWNGFVHAHAAAQLHGMTEIPMDYFTRAVESMLINGVQWDATSLELGPAHWERAVRDSGYVAAQQTVPLQV
ncbi:ATP-binding protein [Variovorax sp. J22R133]|uniref:ATP-binding protein n=1 Tax=Variovorax brevis TaxID=3053503 RepID=UPI00257693FA|nr:ATP-binding protein [Variovorax sp. J22R133]MDM0116816.1 ATP-binding protein [Variovorax sp. J22R133]